MKLHTSPQKLLNNQDSLPLIELIMAIVILGILALALYPNMSIYKRQQRPRQPMEVTMLLPLIMLAGVLKNV